MKEKVIETAGRAWKTLGEKGEVTIPQLTKALKEKETLVCMALGWLSREDKINYRVKNDQTFISLVESELQAFKNNVKTAHQNTQSKQTKTPKRIRLLF